MRIFLFSAFCPKKANDFRRFHEVPLRRSPAEYAYKPKSKNAKAATVPGGTRSRRACEAAGITLL